VLRPIRLLLLVVALTGALGRDRLSESETLCAHHMEMAPTAAMNGQGVAAHAASALTADDHACAHCPPAECATTVPCASGPSSQSARDAVAALVNPPVCTVGEALPAQRAVSHPPKPPTPPPQLAS
jgi:hypothetical protein